MSGSVYAGNTCIEMNEINSLEYGTLKLPYELLNKKFRASQKSIDQHNYFFKKDLAALESKLQKKNAPIKLIDIADDVKRLGTRVSQFNTVLSQAVEDEIKCTDGLLKRAKYLIDGSNNDSEKQGLFKKLRLDRFIADHLLRSGYFKTAEALMESMGLEMRDNINVFSAAKEVEEALARRDLFTCLCWILDNRSKLHRLNSSFETEIRIQQCAELMCSGRQIDAINYAKNYFGHLPPSQWKHGNLLVLFGLLGFGQTIDRLPKECASYKKLLSAERYQELIDFFRQEFNRIFQLNTQSAFSACLHAGLAAHKTPCCKRDPNTKCVACNKLYDLAEGLPVAHEQHSKLICASTGEPLNEENQPLMLPNGRVYGENAVRAMMRQDGLQPSTVRCPRTGQTFPSDEIKRVYVL